MYDKINCDFSLESNIIGYETSGEFLTLTDDNLGFKNDIYHFN